MWCAAQAYPFALSKWAVGIGIELMSWALEFRLVDSLSGLAGSLSHVYDASLLRPLGVRHLAWTVAMMVAGWHLLRSRTARGAGEIATTVLVAAVGSIIVANPQGYLEGSAELARNTSGSILEAVDETLQTDDSASTSQETRARLNDVLRVGLVARPYDLINWGEPLTGRCAEARERILEGDGGDHQPPHGADDWPRQQMEDAGCPGRAGFNAKPTDERATASLAIAGTALVVMALLCVIAVVVIVAQLTLVFLFAATSIFWVAGLVPGARELLWWWLSRLAWAVLATIGATFILSWLAVTLTTVLTAAEDFSIIQRALLTLLVVVVAFRLRGQIGRSIEQTTQRLRHRLDPMAGNTGGGTAGGAFAAGAGGFGLSQMARSWSQDIPGGRPAYHLLYIYGYSRAFTRAMHHRPGHRHTRGAIRGSTQGPATAGRRPGAAVGLDAARGLGRAARTVAMAPVVGPQAYGRARVGATVATHRARAQLQQARRQAKATRQQWAFNARHPVLAMQAAHQQAERAAQRRGVLPPKPTSQPEPPSVRARRRGDAVGSWWRVPGTPHHQQRLPFERPGESYHQLSLDDALQPPQSEQARPRLSTRDRTAEQRRLDFPTLWHQPTLDLHGSRTGPLSADEQAPSDAADRPLQEPRRPRQWRPRRDK